MGGGGGRGGTEEKGRFQVSRFLNPRRPDYLEAWNWIYYVMTTSQATIKGDWYSRMKRSVEKLRRRPLLGSLHTIRIFFSRRFSLLSTCSRRFRAPKMQVFENGPWSGVF